MGAGSVRARYLVYFQYLGTDFKYVLWASHPCPRPLRVAGRRREHPSSSRRAADGRRPRGWLALSLGSAPPASGPGPRDRTAACGRRGRGGRGPGRGGLRALTSVHPARSGVAAVRGAQHAVGVQNYLEEAAERLNSAVPVKFTISSRTDAGVHALSNAAHLDVQRRAGRPPFSPEVLADALNTHLRHPAIRILQAFRVPSHFHARHAATSRTYLYRLATGCPRPDQLPVFERSRCWALRADCLDVAAMQEAAQHLLGTHDFSAFQSAGSPAASPVRTLRRASVSPEPASPFVLPQESRRLRFWTLEFESQSFLYRQVRRMTAVLVAVGLGALTPAQVRVILESRDPLGRHQSRVAPAYGLFLKSVLYESLGSVPKQPCAASACTEVPDELLVPSEVSS
ncbi:tRNA pseudouridine synthase-like 1 isoform X5 [Hippopotamus amphibius kiboko]|uniref:tRNA pseudouridine synthase-like 1 isoform X5 n=1 Tax=Hippopotamus amphibius kiboko TaxID=575201 RepID=UPI0025958DFC|nr:tRNA pseudouridine synthase-like 1 isoform X5 [Hippopotamus amphibius kiboko]